MGEVAPIFKSVVEVRGGEAVLILSARHARKGSGRSHLTVSRIGASGRHVWHVRGRTFVD